MPTFHDPAADAAQAQQALRGLAHTTRTIDSPQKTHAVSESPGPCPGDRQPSGTSKRRVPQLRVPVVVWLDLGGMYSVASHAESEVSSGTAKE